MDKKIGDNYWDAIEYLKERMDKSSKSMDNVYFFSNHSSEDRTKKLKYLK